MTLDQNSRWNDREYFVVKQADVAELKSYPPNAWTMTTKEPEANFTTDGVFLCLRLDGANHAADRAAALVFAAQVEDAAPLFAEDIRDRVERFAQAAANDPRPERIRWIEAARRMVASSAAILNRAEELLGVMAEQERRDLDDLPTVELTHTRRMTLVALEDAQDAARRLGRIIEWRILNRKVTAAADSLDGYKL